MAVPNAVRRQAEKARQQLAAAQAGGDQAQQTPAVVVTNQPDQPLDDSVQGVSVQMGNDVVAPVDIVTEDSAQQAAMSPGSIAQDDYKTRYENLRKSRNLDRAKVIKLEQEIADMRAAAATTEANSNAAPSPLHLTDEERASLTPESLQAYELLSSKIELNTQAEAARTDKQREIDFFDDLESVISDWEEINNDPKFGKWLAEADGFSGRTRQETLLQARNALDSKTVITLFDAYITAVNTAQGEQTPMQQTVATSVEPGRGSAQSNPATAGAGQARRWTSAEVSAFYSQKRQVTQRRRMTPEIKAQFDATESEIRRAHAEGRID